jgi:lipopolysaccharide export system protein LptA
VRLTIERMRTLVLGAGVLLLAALVAFLVVGKGKNPFNHRDLPQRLGMEIQEEANGVTYTQAHGGHTLFKIHASRVVELKKGNALLHDVQIELYGADGSSVDRIEGAEFEYNQKTGTAKAAGPVEITLMRPGVAPAIAPKAAAGAAVAVKPKGTPVASVAEAAARGEIHVKTSGLTFDQQSGVVTTSQHVNFSMVQGAGSSTGATYDSQRGLLVLDRAVELTTRRGGGIVHIHAQHAEFERSSQLCSLQGVTAGYQDGQATAGDAKILFREDGSAVRLDATHGLVLTTATGGRLGAPTGQLDFDEHNQPRHGRLEGGVTMDSVSEAGGWRHQSHGSAPTAELEFNAQGQLLRAHLERGVAMDSREQSLAASGQLARLSRHWRSPVADLEFRDSGHGRTELGVVKGAGGVVVTSESQRGQTAPSAARLSADEVTGTFGPASALTAMSGVGEARIEQTTATGVRQSTSGDRLEAHFAASGAGMKPDAKRASGVASEVDSATVLGHVVLTQTPPAKPGAPPAVLRATAGRADYAGAGEWLHLTGSPRIEDGALQLTADRVDVSQASGDALAHGNVKASWLDAGVGRDGKANPAGEGSVALGGQGPAHVIAAEAQLSRAADGGAGEATFRGQARLWQQANSVSAPVIVLDRRQQTLVAWTRDASQPVRVVLVSETGAGTARNTGKEQEKSNPPSVIRLRGGELKYSNVERRAVMRGGVLGTVGADTATAESVSDEVEVTLLPAGKNAGREGGQAAGQAQGQKQEQAAGQARVDRMTALGHVVLTSEGRRGTGEKLLYTGATGEYVLTGTASAPPSIFDPARGTVTGEVLIFNGRDDSVSIEGGGHKTRTETTAPR